MFAPFAASHEMLTGKTFVPGAYPVEERLAKNLRNAKVIVR